MNNTWWDKKIKYVKEYTGLFRRSHFISMMIQSKKQHELEMDKVRKQLHDLTKRRANEFSN